VRCPSCGHSDDKVIDSRSAKDGRAIRRRRECLSCGSRFTTYEYVEAESLLVVKRDGRREPFSRQKLFEGVSKACGKRPIPAEAIENLVDAVASDVQRSAQSEITSMRIGEMVMEELGRLDEVAYVRFASVYRRFKDITQFMEELKTLLKKSSSSGEGGPKVAGRPEGEAGAKAVGKGDAEPDPKEPDGPGGDGGSKETGASDE
jgi:transcriptional repressor NrdR